MQKTLLKSLYVHFPYCETKCHYCDFFSLPESKFTPGERKNVYSAIIKEFNYYSERNFDTVFFGGGTPSLVPIDVLHEVTSKLSLSPNYEFTLEANPSSVTREKAEQWKSLGINRVSLGVQALDNDRLKWLSRIHSKEEVYQALSSLFESGIDRISIDYILGVPGQSTNVIESEINELFLNFPKINHVSSYLLTLNSNNEKSKSLPLEDEQLSHLFKIREKLLDFGLIQYEISNFAIPGFESKHNQNYWNRGEYIGIGPSAHGFIKNLKLRYRNVGSLNGYVEKLSQGTPPLDWKETLTLEQERIENIMLSLRQKSGLDLQDHQVQFQEDLYQLKKSSISDLIKNKLAVLEQTPACETPRLCLTPRGLFLSESIFSSLAT